MERLQVILTDLDNTDTFINLYKVDATIPSGKDIVCNLITRGGATPAPVPIFVEGLGSGNFFHPNILTNPYLSYTLNGSTGSNDNWTGAAFSGGYSGYLVSGGLGPSGNLDAATFGYVYTQTNQISLSSATSGTDTSGKRGRLVIARSNDSGLRPTITEYTVRDSAWLSYNTSGLNNKKVFSYNFDIIDSISGYESGLLGGNQYQASELLYLSGRKYNSICNTVSLILDNTGITCESPADDILGEPIESCIPSGLTQEEMDARIREMVGTLTSGLSSLGLRTSNLVDDSEVSMNNFDSSYYLYEGRIAYNSPYSGDYIKFEAYNYDFSGQYSGVYNVNPPYPAYTYYFYFSGLPTGSLPVANGYASYTGIDSLVTGLTGLLSTGHHIWLKDLCRSNSDLSGYFETGSLLNATISGNYINLTSNILGSAGKYKFTFVNSNRPNGKINTNSLKYLLPRTVTIQGANSYGTWINIDSRTNLDWNQALSYRPSFYVTSGWTGNSTGAPGQITPPKIGASGEVIKRLIYSGHVTGEDLCGKDFDNTVLFYEVPSGFSCSLGDDPNAPNIENSIREITGFSGNINRFAFNVLRTGFKFENNTNYNYYRLLFEDFKTSDGSDLITIASGFIVNKISFFGYESGQNQLSGAACLYGANYTGQIRGITSGTLTGYITGNADSFGKFCLDKFRVTGIPNDNSIVLFRSTSGIAITPFTGLVTFCVTGTGFYSSGIEGIYFNSSSNCLEFTKPVSGYINGSGQLSGGPYNIIYDSVSNLIGEKQLVVQSGHTNMTGIIPNFFYTQTNQEGFAYYTGILTGIVGPGSGGLFLNSVISFVPTNAYANIPSGVSGYYSLSPTTVFTGIANISVLATGLVSGLATGNITGLVRQLDFYRSFTGVWDITTGFYDFNLSGWNLGSSGYQNSGNQILPYYSGQPDIIPIKISYINSPTVFSNDLALLTITGYDINSGISVILSGTSQYN